MAVRLTRLTTIGLLLSAVLLCARADDEPKKCARCGAENPTCRVCKAVTETKKVPKTEFDCECEHFCVPCPSTLCGVEESCDECGNTICTKVWQQNGAQLRSRRVLKKSTVEEEVTSYKWVVEEICEACASGCDGHELIPIDAGPMAPDVLQPVPAPQETPQGPPTVLDAPAPQLPNR